jgi:uncharacterized protein (TIGR02118 family)
VVKLVFCVRRRPELTRADFQRYWREQHGPLVRRHAAILRIRRYVQVHTLDHPVNQALAQSRGITEEPFDGVAELWWDGLEDLVGRGADPEWQRAGEELLDDERRFIDLARSVLWVAEEHVVIP